MQGKSKQEGGYVGGKSCRWGFQTTVKMDVHLSIFVMLNWVMSLLASIEGRGREQGHFIGEQGPIA